MNKAHFWPPVGFFLRSELYTGFGLQNALPIRAPNQAHFLTTVFLLQSVQFNVCIFQTRKVWYYDFALVPVRSYKILKNDFRPKFALCITGIQNIVVLWHLFFSPNFYLVQAKSAYIESLWDQNSSFRVSWRSAWVFGLTELNGLVPRVFGNSGSLKFLTTLKKLRTENSVRFSVIPEQNRINKWQHARNQIVKKKLRTGSPRAVKDERDEGETERRVSSLANCVSRRPWSGQWTVASWRGLEMALWRLGLRLGIRRDTGRPIE